MEKFDQALLGLAPAAKRVMITADAIRPFDDKALTHIATSLVQVLPYIVSDKLRCVPGAKQSGISPEAVQTLAYHLRNLPVIDEGGA